MSRLDDSSSHLAEDEAFKEACERELVAGQAIHCCPSCQPGQGGDIEITPAVTSEIKVNLKPEKVDFGCPSCGDTMTGFVNFRQWYISPMAEGDDNTPSYFNHEGCSGAGGNYILVCSFDGENLKLRGEPIPLELEEPEPAASGSAVEPFDYKNNPSALFHGGCGYEVHVRKSGDFVLAKAGRFPEETLPKEPTDVEVTCWECDEKFTVRLEDFFTEEELSSPSPSEAATPNPRALSITHSSCHATRFWDLSLRPAKRGQEDIIFKTLLPRTRRTATTVPIVPVFTDEPAASADPGAPSATASWIEGERSRIRTPPIPITRPVPTIATPSPLVTPIHRPAAPMPQPVARQPVPASTPLAPIATPSPKKPDVRRPSSTVISAQEKTMVIRQRLSSTQKLFLAMILGALGAGVGAYAFLVKGSSERPRPAASSAPAATPKDDSLPTPQPVVTPLTISTEPPCPGTVWCSFPRNPDSAAEPFRAECFGTPAKVTVNTYKPANERAEITVKVGASCSAVVEIPEAGETNPMPVHFNK